MWDRRVRESGPGWLGQAALVLGGAGLMAALFGLGVIG